MVIIVGLGHEGMRAAAEKHEDVNTPWAMVVDDDNWSARVDQSSSSTTGEARDVELRSC